MATNSSTSKTTTPSSSRFTAPWPVGRTIVGLRALNARERTELGWDDMADFSGAAVFCLDDGTFMVPQQDAEGNGPGGVCFFTKDRTGAFAEVGVIACPKAVH